MGSLQQSFNISDTSDTSFRPVFHKNHAASQALREIHINNLKKIYNSINDGINSAFDFCIKNKLPGSYTEDCKIIEERLHRDIVNSIDITKKSGLYFYARLVNRKIVDGRVQYFEAGTIIMHISKPTYLRLCLMRIVNDEVKGVEIKDKNLYNFMSTMIANSSLSIERGWDDIQYNTLPSLPGNLIKRDYAYMSFELAGIGGHIDIYVQYK